MNEQLLPKSFTECHERMLSLQKAGYDERFNRTITPSLIALDVLMSVWRFATNRNLLSKPKITEIENLIENALNGKFIRGAWMSIFDDVVKNGANDFPRSNEENSDINRKWRYVVI